MENKFKEGDVVVFLWGFLITPNEENSRDELYVVDKVVDDGYVVRSMYPLEQFDGDIEYEYMLVTDEYIRFLNVRNGVPCL